jgi:ELWxxDGT repeat protein
MRSHSLIEALETRQMLSVTSGPTSVDIGSTHYYAFDDGVHGTELWKSDLDGGNAALVKDIYPGSSGSNVSWLTNLNGHLIFSAGHYLPLSNELWTSDGTTDGTVLLADIYDGGAGSYPNELTVVNNHVVFLAVWHTEAGTDQDVYSTDGTPAGTIQLFSTNHENWAENLTLDNGVAYFDAHIEGVGIQKWQTDGTAAGTFKVSTLVSQGTLLLNGTDGNDNIHVSENNNVITVNVNGETQTYQDNEIQNILVHAGAGDDAVTIDDNITKPATIYGEDGNDTLQGGGGDDQIDGGLGDDSMIGGDGFDVIDYSARSTGITTDAQYGNGIDAQTIFGDNGETDHFEGFESFVGGQGNDSLYFSTIAGTSLNQIVFVDGQGGDDTITLDGRGLNNPIVHGGDGNDIIKVSNWNPAANLLSQTLDYNKAYLSATAYGDAGDDTFLGGNNANDYFGGDGSDKIDYTNALDVPYVWSDGRWSPNFLVHRGINVSLDNVANDGETGSDNVHSDIEEVIGGRGNDTLTAGNSAATLVGAEGDDKLTGGAGNDSLDGGDGHDTIVGDSNDSITSDTSDTFVDDTPPAPVVQTAPATALINGTLHIGATTGDDQISIFLRASNSKMLEVNMNGIITAFKMKDVSLIQVDAGAGNDAVKFNEAFGNITISSKIYGGAGNDIITGASGSDRIMGGDGNDWISGGDGNDVIYGEAGDDRLFGGDGKDYIVGGAGTNVIRGEAGVDRIFADSLIDDIRGNHGDRMIAELE